MAQTLTEVREGADPDEEVRAAVRTVLSSIDAGVPAWAQAILHPPGPGYARAIHQELQAAGVAANGPQRRRLDRSVAGATLLGLLELAASDWARDAVMAWLSTAPIVSVWASCTSCADGWVVPGTGPTPTCCIRPTGS